MDPCLQGKNKNELNGSRKKNMGKINGEGIKLCGVARALAASSEKEMGIGQCLENRKNSPGRGRRTSPEPFSLGDQQKKERELGRGAEALPLGARRGSGSREGDLEDAYKD